MLKYIVCTFVDTHYKIIITYGKESNSFHTKFILNLTNL